MLDDVRSRVVYSRRHGGGSNRTLSLGCPYTHSGHIDCGNAPRSLWPQLTLHTDELLDRVIAMRPRTGTLASQEATRCPPEDGLDRDAQEECSFARSVPVPVRRPWGR